MSENTNIMSIWEEFVFIYNIPGYGKFMVGFLALISLFLIAASIHAFFELFFSKMPTQEGIMVKRQMNNGEK